jgi:hypothetical protein
MRYSVTPTSEWHFFSGLPRRNPKTVPKVLGLCLENICQPNMAQSPTTSKLGWMQWTPLKQHFEDWHVHENNKAMQVSWQPQLAFQFSKCSHKNVDQMCNWKYLHYRFVFKGNKICIWGKIPTLVGFRNSKWWVPWMFLNMKEALI